MNIKQGNITEIVMVLGGKNPFIRAVCSLYCTAIAQPLRIGTTM